MRLLSVLIIAATTLAASPASAERWHVMLQDSRLEYRVDLDSVRHSGRQVTYRLRAIRRNSPTPVAATENVNAIDCAANRRRMLSSTVLTRDGRWSAQQAGRDDWTPIPPGSLSSAIRDLLCARQPD
ncbi:surface-adhesin E family protein [Sphingomonas astaxanthinifaciens]|uniref:Surface-adhesin protein E-like domain-containing protein n=1 Tax=Sphingomonas astaxanthinifaciens DSM 22298 TaxID=1123267 RepID=A0ABQ5Z9B0_9SPHN|nr:surface-adhesin E family protein [Sphingomonas astaxanthinifaciens]GLR47364.1 hypothetical protein GCM10007925_10750 [Sphingomonas astaxanthinifaciens DSM 22298]